MTAQTKTVIKSYFETGDRPTQGQFSDFIDSYQDYDVTLLTLTSASTGIVVKSSANGVVSRSVTTSAGSQINVTNGSGVAGNIDIKLAPTVDLTTRTALVATASAASNDTTAANTAFVNNIVSARVFSNTVSAFTPTITITNGTASGTLTGFYTKKDKEVTITTQLIINSVSAPSGVITIGNLPFTSISNAGARVACAVYLTGVSANFGTPSAYVDVGTSTIVLQELVGGTVANPGSKLTSSSNISIAATYYTT